MALEQVKWPGYEAMKDLIARVPKTMLPGLLEQVVISCVEAKIFNPGGLTSFFLNVKRKAEEAEKEKEQL